MCFSLFSISFLLWSNPTQAELIWDVDVIPAKEYSSKEIDISLVTPFSLAGEVGVFPARLTIDNKETTDKMVHIVFNDGKFVADINAKGNSTEVYAWNIPVRGDDYYIEMTVDVNNTRVLSGDISTYHYDSHRVVYIANHKLRSKYPEWYAFDRIFSDTMHSAHVDNTSLLPTDGYSYSNVESVVWFAENNMEDSQLQAIVDWVKLGGNLVVVQENTSIPLLQPVLQPWLEERFRFDFGEFYRLINPQSWNGYTTQLDKFSVDEPDKLDSYMHYMLFWNPSTPNTSISRKSIYTDIVRHPSQQQLYTSLSVNPVNTFRVGRGFVHKVSDHTTLDNIYLLLQHPLFIEHNLQRQHIHIDNNTLYKDSIALLPEYAMYNQIDAHSIFSSYFIQQLAEDWSVIQVVPPSGVVILSCLFFVLLGPINAYIVSKREKLYFFITTPLLSFMCVLIVVIIGLALNVAVKGFASQFVVYDQRSHIMVGNQQRVFFAGEDIKDIDIAMDSVILPVGGVSRIEVHDKDISFLNYVQHRKVQAQIGYHKSTERTGLRFEGDKVFNDFTFDVDYVYYTDVNGNLWKGESVSANSTAQMIPTSPPSFTTWTNRLVSYPMWTSSTLPSNTYILVSSDAKKLPTFDVVETELKNREWVIYGVLP